MVSRQRDQVLQRVLESAALLKQRIPDAVLVGGSAAALHAGHRASLDHDHVLADLAERYEEILEVVETTEGWATSVRASKPPMTIMGSLGGIEAGLRQLRRTRPLETCQVEVAPEMTVTAPTIEESLRIKAYLIVQRNQVRDYLDVVALADRLGFDVAVDILDHIDDYYGDRSGVHGSVLTSLILRLAKPAPLDVEVIDELPRYKGIVAKWQEWDAVVDSCQRLGLALAEGRP